MCLHPTKNGHCKTLTVCVMSLIQFNKYEVAHCSVISHKTVWHLSTLFFKS